LPFYVFAGAGAKAKLARCNTGCKRCTGYCKRNYALARYPSENPAII